MAQELIGGIQPYLDAETSKLVENTKATEKENNHKGTRQIDSVT